MYNTNTGDFIWFSRWHVVVNRVSSVPSVCRGLCWDMMEFKGSEWKWFLPQQHPPDEGLTVVPGVSFTFGFSPPPAVAPGPILFLISAAMVMKACSTLVAFLALVSKKGIPRESANSWTQQKSQSETVSIDLLIAATNETATSTVTMSCETWDSSILASGAVKSRRHKLLRFSLQDGRQANRKFTCFHIQV